MNPNQFLGELRRRNVYKVAAAYAVVGWLLIQIATQVFPFLEIPNWAIRLIILLTALGFPVAVIIAWAFELTPEGIKRTEVADAARQPRFPRRGERIPPCAAVGPGDAAAKSALSLSLIGQGRLSEAEKACREALSLDPLLTASWYNIGRVIVGMGRYKEAEELFRKGLEMQPHAARFHSYVVILDILQNRPAQAMPNAQLESDGFWRDYAVNLAEQAQSDRSNGDAMLNDFIARYSNTGPFQIAVLYAVRREPDEMFKWLDTAHATRDSGLTQLAVTPFFPLCA